MQHYSEGKPCNCRMTVTDDGAKNYAAHHPNAEPNFNDVLATAIHKSNTERVSSV